MGAQLDDTFRLQEIASDFYAARIDRNGARSAVIDVVMDRLRCNRVSLWKFHGSGDDLALLCFASRMRGEAADFSEHWLAASEYGPYYNGIIERGTYVASDAMNDPGLQPMRQNYLVANHVLSMLDAAFLLNGRAYGMICCEETEQRRDWRAGDVFALRSIATKLALLMSGAADPYLLQNPSLPMRALWPDTGGEPPADLRG